MERKNINEFLEKYKDYGKEYKKELEQLSNRCINMTQQNNEIFAKRLSEEIEALSNRLQEEEKQVRESMKDFSQEELSIIYNSTDNNELKELVIKQVQKNNSRINMFNEYVKNGYIFTYLEEMPNPDEQRKKILKLRETDIDLKIGDEEILKLSPKVRQYVYKSAQGDLSKEKEEFCREKNIKSEEEFIFYVNNAMYKGLRVLSTDIQEMVNNITGNEGNREIIKNTETIIDKTKNTNNR